MDPNPNDIYPIQGSERTAFLKNIIKNPNIIVGDYTYYDDPVDVHHFEKNVLYHFVVLNDNVCGPNGFEFELVGGCGKFDKNAHQALSSLSM
jgi:hypothetical protein